MRGNSLKQIGVGACTNQFNYLGLVVLSPDHKPVGLYMAFPTIGVFA